MQYTNIFVVGAVAIGLLLSSCSSKQNHVSKNNFIYNGINFGTDKDASYKQGVQDGCYTTAGNYTKNSNRFNTDKSYRLGWADGRLQCEQRIQK